MERRAAIVIQRAWRHYLKRSAYMAILAMVGERVRL